MVCGGSILKVADNSGARKVRCIRVAGKKFGTVGDKVVLSVRAVTGDILRMKVTKGEVVQGVIVRAKKGIVRDCGSWVSFDDNAVVIVSAKGSPLGTRVLGPIGRGVKEEGFNEVVSLSMVTV